MKRRADHGALRAPIERFTGKGEKNTLYVMLYISMKNNLLIAFFLFLIGASVASITYGSGDFPQQTFFGDYNTSATLTGYCASTSCIQRYFDTTIAGDDDIQITLTDPEGIKQLWCDQVDSGYNFSTTTIILGTYTALTINLFPNGSCPEPLVAPNETTEILQNLGNGIFNITIPSSTITTTTIFIASTTIFYSFGQTLFYGIILFLVVFFLFGFYFWKK